MMEEGGVHLHQVGSHDTASVSKDEANGSR